MASVIPKMARKRITDLTAAKTLYIALFPNTLVYDPLNVAYTTYAQIAALFTEVPNGSGYVTGGFLLTPTSSYIGATNSSAVFLATTIIAGATFTFRYGIIYDHSTGTIEAVVDMGGDKTVTGGTVTITWDAVNGTIKVS
jgi:hypothetical protein